MAADPSDAEPYVDPVRAVFEEIEADLINVIAVALAAGVSRAVLQQRLLAHVAGYGGQVQQLIGQALADAFTRGQETAEADAGKTGKRAKPPKTNPAKPVLARLIRQAPTMAMRMHDQVNREVTDAMTAGRYGTRKAAAADLLQKYAAKGIVGFTDSAGRSWDLVSYAEVVTRTTTAQTLVDAHLQRLQGMGKDLVIVSDSPEECDLCLVPGTLVEGPAPTGATRLEYTGDIVSILTASGNHLAGTPKHPVLTSSGWRPLKDLRPGDQVISDNREQRHAGVVPDHVQMPTLIEEVGESGTPVLLAGPARRELDSDRTYREVRAVLPDGYLLSERDASFSKPLRDLLLVGRVGPGAKLLGLNDAQLPFGGDRDPSAGCMCWLEHGSSLLGSGLGPTLAHAGAGHGRPFFTGQVGHEPGDAAMARPSLDTSSAQVVTHHSAADAEGGADRDGALSGDVARDQLGSLGISQFSGPLALTDGMDSPRGQGVYEPFVADAESGLELLKRLAGSVAIDEVVSVNVAPNTTGHVWDLTTEPSWFIANGIVTHNCRPWEGKVLSITGATRSGQHSGNERPFAVAGSVAQARAAGLGHPNCRHTMGIFLPGRTRPMENTEDPEGAKLRAQQRYRERKIREQKRRVLAAEAVAGKTSPEAKAARAKLRTQQSDFATWRKANGRKNLSQRTSLAVR